MIIKGLQKLTLLDYPQKCACTIFTYGCNLACPFCHNASLVDKSRSNDYQISKKEVFDFLQKRQGVLDGVVITGGEPLINSDLPDLIYNIKRLGFLVKLDTNGTNPQGLKNLIDSKLIDYVAMDIKNSPEKYPQTVGIKNFDLAPIYKSIELLLSDKVDYEFRTTVCQELFSMSDFTQIGKLIFGAKRYFLQSYVNSGDILCGQFTSPTKDQMNNYSAELSKYINLVGLRGV